MQEVILNDGVNEHINKRKLVTMRKIDSLEAIEGADQIEVAHVEGWKCVVKKGTFSAGDECVYFELDSFLPDGNPLWQFLVDVSPKTFNGNRGHKLRTKKLRGVVSQGFVIPVNDISEMTSAEMFDHYTNAQVLTPGIAIRDVDFSNIFNVQKFEAPLPACLAGQAEGLFPSYLQKSDQERSANLREEIFGYDEIIIPANDVHPEIIRRAKADRNSKYEITLKLDGSSMTSGVRVNLDGIPEVILCSRNLQLKINEANKDNSFVRALTDTGLSAALLKYFELYNIEIAIQGELMAPGIQGNRENFKEAQLFVFDIFSITERRYLSPSERNNAFNFLNSIAPKLQHVPILHESVTLDELNLKNNSDLVRFAEGPSINHVIREGLVFKRADGKFSFKTISEKFLLKEAD
jgi:RNA ligase (TIGR02306 family)